MVKTFRAHYIYMIIIKTRQPAGILTGDALDCFPPRGWQEPTNPAEVRLVPAYMPLTASPVRHRTPVLRRYTRWFRGCMKKYGKFAALIAIVVGTLIWLATAGIRENQTYYKTIAELGQMGDQAYAKRLRVAGDISTGSIMRKGNVVEFTLVQEKLNLKVAY